jgi:hypothetical protein
MMPACLRQRQVANFPFISGTEDRRPMPVRRGGTEDAGHVGINQGLGNFNA